MQYAHHHGNQGASAQNEAQLSGMLSDNAYQNPYYGEMGGAQMMANGRFMITKSIGKGSFGEIFQGLDTQTNKEVAIKMVSSHILSWVFCPLL